MTKTNIDQILEHASDVLGSINQAEEWIHKVSATLGDSPYNLSQTDEGTVKVMKHLNGISRQRQG